MRSAGKGDGKRRRPLLAVQRIPALQRATVRTSRTRTIQPSPPGPPTKEYQTCICIAFDLLVNWLPGNPRRQWAVGSGQSSLEGFASCEVAEPGSRNFCHPRGGGTFPTHGVGQSSRSFLLPRHSACFHTDACAAGKPESSSGFPSGFGWSGQRRGVQSPPGLGEGAERAEALTQSADFSSAAGWPTLPHGWTTGA